MIKIMGCAYIIATIITVCGGNKRPVKKPEPVQVPTVVYQETYCEPVHETQPAEVYTAPAWEYVEWSGYEGEDGGEIYLG